MKKCVYLLLVIMVFTACVGCGNKASAELTDKLRSEIVEKWREKTGLEAQWDGKSGYYGTYNGIVVFNNNGIDYGVGVMYLDAITKITVGGMDFSWPNAFTIYAYKDGQFYNLETAYENGLLTKKNIERIAEHHEEYLYTVTNWERPTK